MSSNTQSPISTEATASANLSSANASSANARSSKLKGTYLQRNREKILAVVTGGVSLALGFVLSRITFFSMPMGGDITPASSLPLIIFSLCFGPVWGFAVCFVFSLLQLIGGYIIYPVQLLFDYTFAYTVIGISGFAAPKTDVRLSIANPLMRLRRVNFVKMIVMILASFIARLVFSILSGVIFFSEYAGDMNPWVYSIVYNGSYLLPEFAITLAVLFVLIGVLGIADSRKQSPSVS